ncbi:MAG: hypothetical protein JW918_15490 [Anaerolineae bacterium]|nr:hypothetical protein [Anaerolineae bacterium]
MQKPWLALRRCWTELESGKARSFSDAPLPADLPQRHADALGKLVADGELEAAVAEKVEAAFGQMLEHVDRLGSMCYIAMPLESVPRGDMMGQIAALEEMAGRGDIDPATVAQVRASLERNIAWLARFQAGESMGLASDFEVDASSAEAARALVQLLLEGS